VSTTEEALKDRLYDEIKYAILTGRYGPRDRLVLSQLAQQYQVSKTPVRDALQALQREGLVEVIPRVGYFVTAMTVKDMRDIFELRKTLESMAVELAIARITDEEIDELAAIDLSYTRGSVETCVRYLQNHRELHYRIALASDNRWLAQYVSELLDQVQRFLFVHLNIRDWCEELRGEHDRLIEALRQRDVVAAKASIVEQAESTKRALIGVLT